MSLFGITSKRQNYGVGKPVKNSLSELNTGAMVFNVHTEMDGRKLAEFHVNIIDLLDRVFLTNCLNIVTPEQERFLERFFFQANRVDELINSNSENIYADMDEIMQQFDTFLGNYYGDDNGRYV